MLSGDGAAYGVTTWEWFGFLSFARASTFSHSEKRILCRVNIILSIYYSKEVRLL